MAHPPAVQSISPFALGAPADGDPSGVQPETLRQLHFDELRLLRSRLLGSLLVTVLAAGAWAITELTYPGSLLFVLFGYFAAIGAFRSLALARRWWTVRRRDPLAAAVEDASARARATTDAARNAARLAARPPRVTNTIAAVLLVIGVLEIVAAGSVSAAIEAAGLDKPKVAAGEAWRLLTAGFVHAATWHLWGNLMALVAIGRLVEAYSTRSRWLVAYLAAILVGNVASCWILPHTTSVGASGGILGLAGFLYALGRRRPNDVPAAYTRAALVTIGLTGVVGALGFQVIDNAAHAGGALAGFLVGWITVPREAAGHEGGGDRLVMPIGSLAAVVLAAGAILTAAKLIAEYPRPVTSLRVELRRGETGRDELRLENLSDAPLEAYTLDVYSSNSPIFRQWRDERGFENAGDGPLAPHADRVVPLGSSPRPIAHPSVHVAVAVFANGTFEGSRQEYDLVRQRRAHVAADADYWISVIDEARALPPDRVAALIDARIGERAKANADARQTTYMGGTAFLLRTALETPDDFAAAAAQERERLATLRDALSVRSR